MHGATLKIVRIYVRVDQCVSADRWRRLYSSNYVGPANHLPGIGGS